MGNANPTLNLECSRHDTILLGGQQQYQPNYPMAQFWRPRTWSVMCWEVDCQTHFTAVRLQQLAVSNDLGLM